MRKIESAMIHAIRTRRDWKSGNTAVWINPSDRTVSVYLHGNLIAEESDNQLYLNESMLYRWPTVTTRSRLNALGFHVNQHNHEQVITRDTVPMADV